MAKPGYMPLSEVAHNICMTEAEVLEMVDSGELPRPTVRHGKTVWDWEKVDAAMNGEDPGRVYFIEAAGLIKIGFTRYLNRRLSQIVSTIPQKGTVLLHHIPGSFDLEVDLHRKFAHLCEHGEWFRKCPELLDFIEERKRDAPGRTENERTEGKPSSDQKLTD